MLLKLTMNAQDVAITAAKKAGKTILSHFKKLEPADVSVKSKHEILTTVDLAAEQVIMAEIRAYFPNHSILSEESGKDSLVSSYTWVIDPLDGTTNFAVGNPIFTVSIALFEHETPILGVVYAPALNEIFVAKKGEVATLNDQPIKVSQKGNVDESYVTFCHGRSDQAIKEIAKLFSVFKLKARSFRQLGSASYELGMLAAGRTDAFIMVHSNLWDVAAGALIVNQAGGKITDFEGKPWNLNSKDFIATNDKLYSKIAKITSGRDGRG